MELPYHQGFMDVDTESDAGNIPDALRKRIPQSLSTLHLRYLQPSDDVPITMGILADLKRQGEFPGLKIVRLNFCCFSKSPWFPPVPYDDVTSIAKKTLGEDFEKAGLQLELEQTD